MTRSKGRPAKAPENRLKSITVRLTPEQLIWLRGLTNYNIVLRYIVDKAMQEDKCKQ
jgi:hypothetical protein